MSGLEGIQDTPVFKAVAYTAYNLGGSVVVGLGRLIVAVAHLVKHYFNSEGYRQQYDTFKKEKADATESRYKGTQSAETKRRKNVRVAEQHKKEAKGFVQNLKAGVEVLQAKTTQKLGDVKDKVTNEVLDGVNEVADVLVGGTIETFESFEEAKIKVWKQEAIRGVVELIPVLGSLVCTTYDLSRKDISLFGLEELRQAIEIDDQFGPDIKNLAKKYR